MQYEGPDDFKEQNGYEVNGTWYPRVTRILDVIPKPALKYFFREMGSQEAADKVTKKSAEEGTLVHEMCQSLAVGENVHVPESVAPSVFAFYDFYKKNNIHFHPEFIEKTIWSVEHKYAGTIDALAEIDGKFGVLDIKTSTGVFDTYGYQTAAYMQALVEESVHKALALPRQVEKRWILRIDQHRLCRLCSARLREKGGRKKIRNAYSQKAKVCDHSWTEPMGEVQLHWLDSKNVDNNYYEYLRDANQFNDAKAKWTHQNRYWLEQIGYFS
ncbi:MAG: hypothetical protein O2794_00355 [bacterium]|nr:hypothetical protein [bacterium]